MRALFYISRKKKSQVKTQILFVFTLPALAYISFHSTGWKAYLPVLEAFVF